MKRSLQYLLANWHDLQAVFTVPQNKKQFRELQKIQDELIDFVKEDQKHPLAERFGVSPLAFIR